MSDCRFGVSPVNYPDPEPIECTAKTDQTVDAQADLSLCWVHRSFCWFCHAPAQLLLRISELTEPQYD